MSDRELPEDFAQWPRDSYQLLGVERDADEKTVKRAYARLIRRYKPEHNPGEFARIRAAYEEILERLRWIESITGGSDDVESESLEKQPNAWDSDLVTSVDSAGDAESENKTRQREQRSSYDQTLAEAWKAACDGELSGPYRQLVQLQNQEPGDEEVYLRLYWLLRLQPNLDPQRQATYWLVECLRRHKFRSRAWDLYRTELKRQPELVDTPENASLLIIAVTENRLFEFLDTRWNAVVAASRWKLIQADLEFLHERHCDEELQTWARILFLVVEKAAWFNHPTARNLIQKAGQQLNEMVELHLEMREEFERHDVMWDLASAPRLESLHILPANLVKAIQDAWFKSADALRRQLQTVIADWVRNPRQALAALDEIRSQNPVAFHQLFAAIRSLEAGDQLPDDSLRRFQVGTTTQDFFFERVALTYDRLRLEVLDFCLKEHISLQEVLHVLENHLSGERWGHVWGALNEDLPLGAVLGGIAAFWA